MGRRRREEIGDASKKKTKQRKQIREFNEKQKKKLKRKSVISDQQNLATQDIINNQKN